MKVTFRALTVTVAVEIDDDLPHRELARALIATYPASDAPPRLSYHLARGAMSRDGARREVDDPLDLIPVFELDLYEQVVARAEPGWLMHAAAIAIGNTALVLAGPSEAGKTTMTLALVARGHRLLTEEMVAVDARGDVRGLCRPLHVRAQEHVPATWPRIAYPMRERGGAQSEHALVLPPSAVIAYEPLPIRGLVRLTHGPKKPLHLRALAPTEALSRFWDTTLRPDDPGLAAATIVLRSTPAYELSSATFGDALATLEPLLKSN